MKKHDPKKELPNEDTLVLMAVTDKDGDNWWQMGRVHDRLWEDEIGMALDEREVVAWYDLPEHPNGEVLF